MYSTTYTSVGVRWLKTGPLMAINWYAGGLRGLIVLADG